MKIRLLVILLFTLHLFSACSDDNIGNGNQKQVYVLFSTSGLGDMGYNDCILNGVQEIRRDYESRIDFTFHFPASLQEGKNIASKLVAGNTENTEALILLASSEYEPLADELKEFLPPSSNRKILFFESSKPYQPPIYSFKISMYGASYLAGITAGSIRKSPLVLQAYNDDKVVADARDGFVDGFGVSGDTCNIHHASLASDYSGYFLSEVAYEKMEEWSKSYDFIFPIAGGANMGIYRYLREYADDVVYTAGMDIDQSAYCSQIVGSVVKHIDRLLVDILSQWISSGTLPAHSNYGLENGYADWSLAPAYQMMFNEKVEEYRNNAIQEEIEYNKGID